MPLYRVIQKIRKRLKKFFQHWRIESNFLDQHATFFFHCKSRVILFTNLYTCVFYVSMSLYIFPQVSIFYRMPALTRRGGDLTNQVSWNVLDLSKIFECVTSWSDWLTLNPKVTSNVKAELFIAVGSIQIWLAQKKEERRKELSSAFRSGLQASVRALIRNCVLSLRKMRGKNSVSTQ